MSIHWDNKIKLTFNGDLANIHDPTKHLSPECATANRQGIYCELASSKELMALNHFVENHGMYFWLLVFWLAYHLSGASLKEPKHCKLVNQDAW